MEFRCRVRIGGWRLATLSELRNSLQMTDDPAIGPRCHQYNIMHYRVFAMYAFAAVQNLEIVFRRIVQLENVAFWGIENGLQFVVLIRIARSCPIFLLTIYFARKARVRLANEKTVERSQRIRLECYRQIAPRELVVTQNGILCESFHLTRASLRNIQGCARSGVCCDRLMGEGKSDYDE